MAARERLQYCQSVQGDAMLVDSNYLSSLMTNNLPYHNGTWTTLLPMSDISLPQAICEGSTPSLDSPALKSATREEKRRSDNWASYVLSSVSQASMRLTHYFETDNVRIEIAKLNT